jgi:hypothetical protein
MDAFLNIRRSAALVVFALGSMAIGADAQAKLVAIEYWDKGIVDPVNGGGPLWTGDVDTQADILTIRTWKELPGHGSEFWIPRSLPATPLVWVARAPNGDLFDVPDNFDVTRFGVDGGAGDFAFVSDARLQDMPWLAPRFDYSTNPPTPILPFEEVTFSFVVDVWPGWGGYAIQELVPGTSNIVKAFHMTNPNPGTAENPQPVFDEMIMPALPVKPDTISTPAVTWSTEATVFLTPAPPTDQQNTAVPEARQWLALSAALVAAMAVRWLMLRRRAEPEPAL